MSIDTSLRTLKKYRGPIVLLWLGMFFSFLAYFIISTWERDGMEETFLYRADTRLAALQADLERQKEILESVAGLFSSSQHVTVREFSTYARGPISRYPAMQAISWNPLLTHEERLVLETKSTSEGGIRVTERDDNGVVSAAKPRDEYVVVSYIEPIKGNEKAVGFDIYSSPSRRQAIEQARDSGEVVITERVDLVQTENHGYGYLALKAVYEKGVVPQSVEQRRSNFIGLVVGVLRFDKWVPYALRGIPPGGVDIEILDARAPEHKRQLHHHYSRMMHKNDAFSSAEKPEIEWSRSVSVMGREWFFVFSTTSAFLQAHNEQLLHSEAFLLAGTTISVLLSLLLFNKVRNATQLSDNNRLLQREVNARKKTEAALRDSETRYRVLVNSSPDWIWEFGSGQVFDYSSDRSLNVIGLKARELLGRNLRDVFSDDEGWFIRMFEDSGWKGIVPVKFEHSCVHVNGNEVVLETSCLPGRGRDGRVSSVRCVSRDITDKRAIEEEQKRLQEELLHARKMESLGQLTGGVAHDFNNLLSIISGYTNLAYEKMLSDGQGDVAKYLSEVKLASDKATSLVSQMLLFSRKSDTNAQPELMAALIADDIKMLRPLLPSLIEIATDISEEPLYVRINPTQLNQVLINLAVNARDAIDGAGRITLTLNAFCNIGEGVLPERAMRHKEWVELAFCDTGCGMSSDVVQNVFEPFFTTKPLGAGTGMGLSVVYGIVQSVGGYIQVESKPGRGTCFYLRFPVCDAPKIETASNDDEAGIPQGSGEHILVVDDEPSIAQLYADVLGGNGYRVTALSDSEAALKHFCTNSHEFSAIVSDQTMPKLSGLELLEEVRKSRPDIKVILCSGYSTKLNADVAAELGVSYLEKPVNAKELLERLASDLSA